MAGEKGGSAITDVLQSRAGLAAIITALIGLLMYSPSELNSLRPGVEPSSSKYSGVAQDVDARLWQDPFQAIKEAAKNVSGESFTIEKFDGKNFTFKLSKSKESEDHPPKQIYGLTKRIDGTEIRLMAVMMSAAPTPEQHEARLRRRYALVSALANRGYAPVDAEHIGYFKTIEPEKLGLPKAVPFEWFEKSSNDGKPSRVLVLWVDDSQFFHIPIEKISKIIEQATEPIINELKVNAWGSISRIVMGPNSSDHLKAMAMEVSKLADNLECSSIDKIKFYSALATTADSNILDDTTNPRQEGLANFMCKRGIFLTRTITDDETVIKALVKELRERHVMEDKKGDDGEGDHVVLLSDWDTLYGRTLPTAFGKAYEHRSSVKCGSLDSNALIHCFKYIRGIDGILPGASARSEEKSATKNKPEPGAVLKPDDRPDGMSQKDYLRRLVEEIRLLDKRLLKKENCLNPSRRCGVAAIGVLGYDVYDKLMILRALRPYFPNKIFFTTDLSASYWSPAELPYTHNLLVASSFGQRLGYFQQKGIPPFRDGYQTAFFFSTLMALDKMDHVKAGWIDTPRIFEIGRNGPVDLSVPREHRMNEKERADCEQNLSACLSIHPLSIAEFSGSSHVAELGWALTALLLLYLTSWSVRRWTNHILLNKEAGDSKRWLGKLHWRRIVLALCLILIVLKAGEIVASFNIEPLLWFEGVSIWPSELLRFAALIACWVLLFDVRKRIAMNDEEMATAFGLKEKEKNEQPSSHVVAPPPDEAGSPKGYCSSALKWQSKKEKVWLCDATPGGMGNKVVIVNRLWEEYRRLGEFKRRFCRSFKGILVFFLFAGFSIALSGGLTVPARGDAAFLIDRLLIGTAIFFVLLLTMLVVDASRLCAAFISHLDEAQSDWATGSKNPSCEMIQQADMWRLNSSYIACWLDVQFVARHTKALQKLIWYPILPIFLLAIARSPIFDDWSHPPGLIATMGVLIVYLISCAFWLERGAKKMRRKATVHLGEELRTLYHLPGDNLIKIGQLEKMIKEIEELKEGAFLPFFQQPWVEAVLTLASGAGGLAWLGNFLGAS